MSSLSPQSQRVLKALENAGERGITRVDFQLPDVIDNGKPILNFPARIFEIHEEGIGTEKAGKRNGCDVYRLTGAATPIVLDFCQGAHDCCRRAA